MMKQRVKISSFEDDDSFGGLFISGNVENRQQEIGGNCNFVMQSVALTHRRHKQTQVLGGRL